MTHHERKLVRRSTFPVHNLLLLKTCSDILLEQATFESLNRDKLGYMWDIMLRYYWDILLEQATFEIIEQEVRTSCCIGWRLVLWRSPPACCWACEREGDEETAESAHHCPLSRSFFDDKRKTALWPLLWLSPDYVGSIKKMVRSHRVQLASDRLKGVIPSLKFSLL